MRKFYYHFRSAVENIKINQTMVFFSLLSLSLTLMLFGLFLLFYFNVQDFVQSMRESVQFSVYLSDSAKERTVSKIKKGLESDVRILSSTYISKKEALDIFNRSFEDKALIARLGENPLPASFEVVVKAEYQEASVLKEIVEQFQNFSGVEEVQYGSEWLENLNIFLDVLKIVGLGVGIFLAVTVTTNIANTIRLHFYTRYEEVEIMKLIGATHAFIKVPFFLEGLLMGLLSGGLATLLLYLLFGAVQKEISPFLSAMGSVGGLQFLPLPMLISVVIAGGLLGGIGSFISLNHLLRLRNPDYENNKR